MTNVSGSASVSCDPRLEDIADLEVSFRGRLLVGGDQHRERQTGCAKLGHGGRNILGASQPHGEVLRARAAFDPGTIGQPRRQYLLHGRL